MASHWETGKGWIIRLRSAYTIMLLTHLKWKGGRCCRQKQHRRRRKAAVAANAAAAVAARYASFDALTSLRLWQRHFLVWRLLWEINTVLLTLEVRAVFTADGRANDRNNTAPPSAMSWQLTTNIQKDWKRAERERKDEWGISPGSPQRRAADSTELSRCCSKTMDSRIK